METRLLRQISQACDELSQLARPFNFPQPDDEWSNEYTPLGWEPQLHWLWFSALDAFDILRTLGERAAPSTLAQLRLLMEQHGLISWLVEHEADRRSRSFCLAFSEIQDAMGLARAWRDKVESQGKVIHRLTSIQKELTKRAKSEGIRLRRRPNLSSLVEQYGDGPLLKFQYSVLSDMGSHAGTTGALALFSNPATEPPYVMDPLGVSIHRAYYLGLGFQFYGEASQRIADARGWGDLLTDLTRLIKSQDRNLRAIHDEMERRE